MCLLSGTSKCFAILLISRSSSSSHDFFFISRSMATMPSFSSSTDNLHFIDFGFFQSNAVKIYKISLVILGSIKLARIISTRVSMIPKSISASSNFMNFYLKLDFMVKNILTNKRGILPNGAFFIGIFPDLKRQTARIRRLGCVIKIYT